ncbi:breast cancer type 2 susceptibility protein [Gracilinanus agilis]|uniref:breast cancer type 2 susceptibility protein n=1 Tax=Gracilinanus agilis TaxID=191870 RepID=UPI001CFEBB78|nr:breast cancer type 2 susceptibility protein [Gracilinanus agilis]
MSAGYQGKTTFFEVFKTRCSESDLGPISLNWFEELTSEAPPYNYEISEDPGSKTEITEVNYFKTPQRKPFTYNHLASTPLIFKEQNVNCSLNSSPLSGPDHCKLDLGKDTAMDKELRKSHCVLKIKLGQANDVTSPPLSTCLSESPAVLRGTYRTPQREKPVSYGNLLYTPKLMKVNTPKHISESLGAEVDPDMSWSSSLATPPTLSSTVLIVRDGQTPRARTPGDTSIMLRKYLSQHGESPKRLDRSTSSVPHIENIHAEGYGMSQELEKMIDDSFDDGNNFKDHGGKMMINMPNIMEEETCDPVINTPVEDDASFNFTGYKKGNLRKVKLDKTRKKYSKLKTNEREETETLSKKNNYSSASETELEYCYPFISKATNNEIQKSIENVNEELLEDDVPSSATQWSQLNLSGLDVTQIEKTPLPHISFCVQNSEEGPTNKSNEDSSLSTLKTVEIAAYKEDEKKITTPNKDSVMLLKQISPEISPPNSTSQERKSSKFKMGLTSEETISMDFLESSSLCIGNTSITTEAKIFENNLEIPKSSIDDIVCSEKHGSLSPNKDGKGSCPTVTKCNSAPLNSTGIISHFKKRTKKFIYVVSDDSSCQGEKIKKTQEIESVNCSASSHLELNSSEEHHEFTNAISDFLDSSIRRKCLQFDPEEQTAPLTGCDKTMMEEYFNESRFPHNEVTSQDVGFEEIEMNRGELESAITEIGNQTQSQERGYNDFSKRQRVSNTKECILTATCLPPRKHSEVELGSFGENSHFPTKNSTSHDSINSSINSLTQLPQDTRELSVVIYGEKEPLCEVKQKPRFRRNSDSTFITNKVRSELKESFGNIKENQETGGDAQEMLSEKCKEVTSISLGAQVNIVSLRDQEKTNLITEKTAIELYPEENLPLNKENFIFQTIDKKNLRVTDNSEEFFATSFCYLGESIPENSTEIDRKQTVQELFTEDSFSSEIVPEFTEDSQDKNQYSKLVYECISQSNNSYSKNTIDTNVKPKRNEENYLGKWAEYFDPDSNKSFSCGFKTASNKEIILSEHNIKKGKLFFKDIEQHYNSSSIEVVNTSTSVAAENIKTDLDIKNQDKNSFPAWKSGPSHIISKDAQSNIFVLNEKEIDTALEDLSLKKDLDFNHNLTASQKAEITELSTILEETGSQFEFTQFGKQGPTVQTLEISTNKVDELGNLNTFELQMGFELGDHFGAKYETDNNRSPEQADLNVNSEVVINVKQRTVYLPKSNSEQGASTDIFNENEMEFKGFCSALGRKMNVSNEALQTAMKLFSDIEEIGDSPLQNLRNSPLDRSQKSNIVPAFKIANYIDNSKDFKGKDAKYIHKPQCNVENNTGIFVEENMLNCSRDPENKESSSPLFISSHKDSSKLKGSVEPDSDNNFQREINGLSSFDQQNINPKMSDQLIIQESYPVKEGLLDLIYLGKAVKDEKNFTSNVSGMEELVSNQEEQKMRENENSSQLPSFQTASGRNIMVSKDSFSKVAHLFTEECSVKELNDFSFPFTLKMPNIALNKSVEPSGKESENLVENEIEEMALATKKELMPIQKGPKIENKKWKEYNMVGFHTASGKEVIISKESMTKVKHFFVEENLENDVISIKNPKTEFFNEREKVNEKLVQAYEIVELNNAQVCEEMQSFQDNDEKVLVPVRTTDLPKITDSMLSNEPSNDILFEGKLSEIKENCILSDAKQFADLPVEKSGLGFYTGHGKSISVSETSLLKARKWLREIDLGGKTEASSMVVSCVAETMCVKADSDVHVENSVPLCTSNNISSIEDNKNISDKQDAVFLSNGMSNIKHNLKHDIERSDFCHSDNADFFSEHISDKIMSCLKAQPPAFTTASGKTVHISNEAVQKAREMFINDGDKYLKPNIENKSENNHMKNVKDPSKILENKDISPKSFDGKNRNISMNDISISNKIHSKKAQLETMSTNTGLEMDSEVSHCQINSKTSDLYKYTIGRQPKCSPSVGIFCTANGKPVQVSDNSLKKARQVFSEIANDSEQLLSLKGSESHPETSIGEENAILYAKTNLPAQKKGYLSNMQSLCNNSGFNTASGKQVLISENALQKVKGMLVEFDLMKNECLESIQDVTPKALSPVLCIEGGETPKHIVNFQNKEICNKELNFSNNCNVEITSSENRTIEVSCDQFKQDVKQSLLETKLTPAKEISFLKKGQVGLKNVNVESNEAIDGLPFKRNLQVSSPNSKAQETFMEREAVEIAKAFMQDDEFTDSELPHNTKQSFFTYKNNEEHILMNSRFGKRRMEEHASYGEPPIKRKLLYEFDRAVENQGKSLKPSKSSPDGTMKDRQKFMHHISLKPVTCDPFSTTKEWRQMRYPSFTAPDQELTSKYSFLKHQTLENSSHKLLLRSPSYKVSSTDNGKMKSISIRGKPAKVFVPPFKTNSNSSIATEEQYVRKRFKVKVKENTPENEKQNYRDAHNSGDSENNENYLSEKNNFNQATTHIFKEYGNSHLEMIENFQHAREMQDMRIKKKQTQQIHPQAGSLYLRKTSTLPRISLRVAVEGKVPSTYSSKQLYMYGISKQCLRINSKNSESFKFHIEDYFSKEHLLDGNGIQLADGGWLIPTDEGKLGKEEFYRALCDTPGVDPKLITKTWVYNHYRWIIWKLAAMEFTFPKEFASRCLTPEWVLLQLKYRYDIEIDESRRSAIKKIMERDETAAKTLVLCVSEIISSGTNISITANGKNSSVETKKESAVIEVTDGWYAIKALLDPSLLALLQKGKLTIGQKIITHGAELVGSQEACTPLEAPESLMLKLSANSTRPARWYAKLGFFSDPRPFPLPLSSLFSEGGNVGCVDIVVQRVYPTQWMEKTLSGLYIFRNERAEEKEALKHTECQQKKLEALLTKIQAEFEKHEEDSARQHRQSRILTRQQVRALQDGGDLYEAVKNAPDPAYIEGCFSKEQLRTLNHHRQLLNDKKQEQLQAEFRKAVAAAELEEQGLAKRDVTTVWKLRVVNYKKHEKDSVILSIWRPLSDIYSLLKEGNRYRIYNLATSPSKNKSDRAHIRLTATKKTQYQQLPVSHEALFQVYQPREAVPLNKLLEPSFQPPCAEVDIVGVVILVTKKPGVAPLAYLSDEYYNLLAVKFWIDLNEDVIKLHTLIAASNLQWRTESRAGIPMLFAGEFSVFSASPKESHFQETFNKLKNSIENIDLFCDGAEKKLTHLLDTHNSKQPNAVKEYNLDSPSPQAKLGLGHTISTFHREPNHHTPEGNSGGTISSVKVTPTSDCRGDRKMDDPKICKKRRSLDFLSRVPLPPPISPIHTFVSPAAQKAFQPPRSCSNKYNVPIKKDTLNSPQRTTIKTLSGTTMVENDLIADEELAQINTQALLTNSSE